MAVEERGGGATHDAAQKHLLRLRRWRLQRRRLRRWPIFVGTARTCLVNGGSSGRGFRRLVALPFAAPLRKRDGRAAWHGRAGVRDDTAHGLRGWLQEAFSPRNASTVVAAVAAAAAFAAAARSALRPQTCYSSRSQSCCSRSSSGPSKRTRARGNDANGRLDCSSNQRRRGCSSLCYTEATLPSAPQCISQGAAPTAAAAAVAAAASGTLLGSCREQRRRRIYLVVEKGRSEQARARSRALRSRKTTPPRLLCRRRRCYQ